MSGPGVCNIGQGVLVLFIGNGFAHLTPVTLTFDPVTPKSKGSSATQDGCVDKVWGR